MGYERPGFDPTNPEDKTFEVYRTGADGINFHIIGLSKIVGAVDGGQSLPLINYIVEAPESPLASIRASIGSGPNLQGSDSFQYQSTIDMVGRGDSAYRSRFPKLMNEFGSNDSLSITRFHFDEVSLVGNREYETALNTMYYNSSSHELEIRNQSTFRTGLQDHRLSAPVKNVENTLKEYLHFLSSIALGIHVGTALVAGEIRPLQTPYDFVMTPLGPLHRNPDTGEYVHQLERDRIEVGLRDHQKKLEFQTNTHLIENSRLEDLYGLEGAIKKLQPHIVYYKHPELAQKWGAKPPGGILIDGPPGGGKTSLVYALANEISATVHEVKGNETYGRFVGDSQKMAQELFDKLRNTTELTVVLFDELESLIAVDETGHGSGSQAINGVAGIFKREIIRVSNSNPKVIFAATTNNTDRVNPELIRTGRFNVKISVGHPNDKARKHIFSNLIIKSLNMDVEPSAFTDATVTMPSLFQIYDSQLLTTEALTELVSITADFSAIDIITVLDNAVLTKMLAEAEGRETGPVTLSDLRQEIFEFRRS